MSTSERIPVGKMIDWNRLDPTISNDLRSALELLTLRSEWVRSPNSKTLRAALYKVYAGKCGYHRGTPLGDRFVVEHVIPRQCIAVLPGDSHPLDNLGNYLPTTPEMNPRKRDYLDLESLPALFYILATVWVPKLLEEMGERSERIFAGSLRTREKMEEEIKNRVLNVFPKVLFESMEQKLNNWVDTLAIRSIATNGEVFSGYQLPILEVTKVYRGQNKATYTVVSLWESSMKALIPLLVKNLDYEKLANIVFENSFNINEKKVGFVRAHAIANEICQLLKTGAGTEYTVEYDTMYVNDPNMPLIHTQTRVTIIHTASQKKLPAFSFGIMRQAEKSDASSGELSREITQYNPQLPLLTPTEIASFLGQQIN